MTYRIFVNTLNGKYVYKNVEEYTEEGSFLKFKDSLTKKIFLYPISNCQIEVEE